MIKGAAGSSPLPVTYKTTLLLVVNVDKLGVNDIIFLLFLLRAGAIGARSRACARLSRLRSRFAEGYWLTVVR